MKHPISPMRGRVLVRPTEGKKFSAGGLHIPETAQEKKNLSQRGTVLAVGDGFEDDPMDVVVGDDVLISKHAGNLIVWFKEELIMLDHLDVLAVLTKEE